MTAAELRTLLSRAKRGDDGAFEALVVSTRDPLFAAARRLVGREALADEVLQEAYVALWSQTGVVPDNPEAWLRTAVVHRSLDHLRREETRRSSPWDTVAAEPVAAGAGPLELVEAAEISGAFEGALESIPPAERGVFVLRAFEGWSFDDIASRMGTAPSTARNQFASARRRMAAALRQKGVTP